MKPGGISDFSRDFAAALRGVMAQHGVRQNALAAHTGRSDGYVSEHLTGVRAVDTDMLDAVSDLAKMDTGALVVEVIRRMAAAGDPSARRVSTQTPAERYAAGYQSVDKPEESDEDETDTA